MFSMLVTAAVFLFVCLFLASAIIAGGAGVGWLLNWIFPSINFGMATLIGVIALIPSIFFVVHIKTAISEIEDSWEADDDDDDDEDEGVINKRYHTIDIRKGRRKR